MEVFYAFCTNIVERILRYFEYLLNHTGNNHILNATTTVLLTTAIKPIERIEIDNNETSRKIHHFTNNNVDDHSFGIKKQFRKKETLKKNTSLEFSNTEPAYYYNDIEKQKRRTNSSGLYYGTFYENVKFNETKLKYDEEKKFQFFESMRRDIMGRTTATTSHCTPWSSGGCARNSTKGVLIL